MPSGSPATVRKLLRALMEELKISQSQLARDLKISRVPLNRFLRGQSDLRLRDYHKILSALGVPMETILDKRLAQVVSEKSTGSLVGIGEELECILLRLPRVDQKAYLGQVIAFFDLVGSKIPKGRRKRLQAVFSAHRV